MLKEFNNNYSLLQKYALEIAFQNQENFVYKCYINATVK